LSSNRIKEPKKQSDEGGESSCNNGDLELLTPVILVQNNTLGYSSGLNQDEQLERKGYETPRFS